MNPESDLRLVQTADLVTELLSRCDHGIISVLLLDTPDVCRYKRWWKGNSATCMGLAHKAGGDALAEWDRKYPTDLG
jgi:hypothetical protein